MRKKSGTKRRTGTGRQRLSPTPAMMDAAALHRAHRIAEAFAGAEHGGVLESDAELTIEEPDTERREAIKLVASALRYLPTGEIQLVAASIIHEWKLLDEGTRDRLHGMSRE